MDIKGEVTSIDISTFSECTALTSIDIPSSVTTIGQGAFSGCYKLASITLPLSLTTISSQAFYACKGLTSLEIPNSVTRIGSSAFSNCAALTSVSLPSGITYIDGHTFSGCSDLKKIIIPEGVESIIWAAFQNCSSLSAVTLPSSLATLGEGVFYGCTSLADVYCYAEDLPSTDGSFKESSYKTARLYVQEASLTNYQATAPWSEFASIVALDGEVPPPYEKCATPTITIVNGKLSFACETEGVEYAYMISIAGNHEGNGNDIMLAELSSTYLISVYAKKEGYKDSDVATQTITYQAKLGDANEDGEISIADITILVNTILENNNSNVQ